MSAPDPDPNAPEPVVDLAADLAVARAERCLAVLERLADKGLALAESVEEDGSADSAEAFAQLSRAVRLTLILKAKFEEGPRPRTGSASAQTEIPSTAPAASPNPETSDSFAALKTGRKAEVRELVREVIDREIADPEDNDTLVDALEERLLCDEAYDDIEGLPLLDIVLHLCGDLKLNPDLRRWTGTGWKPNPPFTRPLCSDFRTPSRTPILNDAPDPHLLE